MTELNEQNFFENVGGGNGAPSARLKEVNDGVFGEIVDQFMTEATDFSTKKPKTDTKTGATIMQLVVVVQTALRDWAGVSKIPQVDKDDASKGLKPPSEDDGRRAVYIEPWTNIHAAVGKATKEANPEGKPTALKSGGQFGVKVVAHKDTGKGNPLKIHEAKYVPPAASTPDQAFFNQTSEAAPAAPAAPAPQAPAPAAPAPAATPAVSQDPWATPAPAAPAQNDPWAAPAADQPPF